MDCSHRCRGVPKDKAALMITLYADNISKEKHSDEKQTSSHLLMTKRLYVNNWKVNNPKLINEQLEQAANNWNELLTTTSGELDLEKCSHDTLHRKFNNDGTVTTSESYDTIEIKVKKKNFRRNISHTWTERERKGDLSRNNIIKRRQSPASTKYCNRHRKRRRKNTFR